jgi:hypothetical protein
MLADILIRALAALALVAVVLFMPRWTWWLSLRSAYSLHDVLRGEHGLDRFSYGLIVLIVYGFLIYLSIALEPLFHPGITYFCGAAIGVLLLFPAVTFWPRKGPPNESHE